MTACLPACLSLLPYVHLLAPAGGDGDAEARLAVRSPQVPHPVVSNAESSVRAVDLIGLPSWAPVREKGGVHGRFERLVQFAAHAIMVVLSGQRVLA